MIVFLLSIVFIKTRSFLADSFVHLLKPASIWNQFTLTIKSVNKCFSDEERFFFQINNAIESLNVDNVISKILHIDCEKAMKLILNLRCLFEHYLLWMGILETCINDMVLLKLYSYKQKTNVWPHDYSTSS